MVINTKRHNNCLKALLNYLLWWLNGLIYFVLWTSVENPLELLTKRPNWLVIGLDTFPT